MANKILIAIVLCVLFYGFCIEPNQLKTTRYRIPDASLKGVRVVFVSDFHIKSGENARLKKIINAITSQKADVILSAGGFLSGNGNKSSMSIEKIMDRLSIVGMGSKFFTVLGDSDTKTDRNHVATVLTKGYVQTLPNTNRKISAKGKYLYIAGVEGNAPTKADITNAFKNVKGPVILLSHNPNVIDELPVKPNLILAGHTHGGQIYAPVIGGLIMPGDTKREYAQGYIEHEDGKRMIVTKGLGTGFLPFRLNCPPEIVIIDFE